MKRGTTKGRRKAFRWLIIILVAAFALPVISLFIVLPLLAKWGVFTPYVQAKLTEAFGWETQIGKVELWPLSEVDAQHVVLGGAHSRISCRSVRVRFAPLDVLRHGRIESVEITGLRASLGVDSRGNLDLPQIKPAKERQQFDSNICQRITLRDAAIILRLPLKAKPGKPSIHKKYILTSIEGEISAVEEFPAAPQSAVQNCFTFSVYGLLVDEENGKSELCRLGASGTIFDPAGAPGIEARVLVATTDLKRLLAALDAEDALRGNELAGCVNVDVGILYRKQPPADSSKLSVDLLIQGEKLSWKRREDEQPTLQDAELCLSGHFYSDLPFANRLVGLDVETSLCWGTEANGGRRKLDVSFPQVEAFFGEAAGGIVRFVAAVERLRTVGTPLDDAISTLDEIKAVVTVAAPSSTSATEARTEIMISHVNARMKSGAEVVAHANLSLGRDTTLRARLSTDSVEMSEILRLAGFDTTVVRGRGICGVAFEGTANVAENGDIAFGGTAALEVERPGRTAAGLCLPTGGAELSICPRGVILADVAGELVGATQELHINFDTAIPAGMKLCGTALFRPLDVGGRRLTGFVRASLPRKENMACSGKNATNTADSQTQTGNTMDTPAGIIWREGGIEIAHGLVPLMAAHAAGTSARGKGGEHTTEISAAVPTTEDAGNDMPAVAVSLRKKRRNSRLRQARIAALLRLAGVGLESVPLNSVRQLASVAIGAEYAGGEIRRRTTGADGDLSLSIRAIGLREKTVEDILAVRAFADFVAGAQHAAKAAATGSAAEKSIFSKFAENPRGVLKGGRTNFSFNATRRDGTASRQKVGVAPVNGEKKASRTWQFNGVLFPERWAVSLGDETLAAERVQGMLKVSGTVEAGSRGTGAPVNFILSGQLGFDALLADRFFLEEDRLSFTISGRYEPGGDGAAPGRLTIASAQLETPSYGVCRAAGTVSLGEAVAPEINLHVQFENLVHERIFKDFLQNAYGETHAFLKDAAWTGTTNASLRVYTCTGSRMEGEDRASIGGNESEGRNADESRRGRGETSSIPRSLCIDGKVDSAGDLKVWDILVSGYHLQTPVKIVVPLTAVAPSLPGEGGVGSGEYQPARDTETARPDLSSAADVEGVLPLDWGRLRVTRIETGPIVIPGIVTRVAVAGNDIFCYDPISFDLFGGEVGIAGLSLMDIWGESASPARLRCKGRIAGVDLGLLSSSYGLKYELEGTIDADFEEIEISSEHILLKGRRPIAAPGGSGGGGVSHSTDRAGGDLQAAVAGRRPPVAPKQKLGDNTGIRMSLFGGEVNVTKLAIARPLSDMRRLTVSLDFEGIDLERVTRSFTGIGRMTGILRGNLNNLEVMGGELIGFETWVETVSRPRIPQRISSEAIRSLQRITGGIHGIVEDHLKRREWRYQHLGFYARLRGGRCLFRGRYFRGALFLGLIPFVGKLSDDYILSGKIDRNVQEHFVITPFGGVNIINGAPGRTVRYDDLVSTVKSILEGRTKPRVK